jgi:hypothetical protein
MQKFYRLSADGLSPSLGPFYGNVGLGIAAAWGFMQPDSGMLFGHSRRVALMQSLRAAKFPGVLRPEYPAHGWLDCPAAAGITDHSTLTLNDGYYDPVVFEFVKSGIVTPGNQEVDLVGVVTAEDVADELAEAILIWTTANVLSSAGGGPGFLANQDGAEIRLVQAGVRKNFIGAAAGEQPWRGTWVGKTMGALGNNAIVASVPGEWTGRIRGMTGGKARLAGVYARTAGTNEIRAQALNGFAPELAPPPEIG